jgi:serine phosphatase RsbU (regulator of sigma subunit)
MFITLFYGVLEPATGELSYVNAGHNPPLILPAGPGPARELESSALPLGIVSGQVYEIAHTVLAPGEQLISFSDGITEAMNVTGEPYGDERLHDTLRAHSGTPAPALVEAITRIVDEYAAGAPQADDMTLLIIQRQA